MNRIKAKLLPILLSLSVSSCASYKAGFSCPDAVGVDCTSMERVDQLISNGKIEEYTYSCNREAEFNKTRRCRKCSSK